MRAATALILLAMIPWPAPAGASAAGPQEADPRVDWLREHAVEIATIEPASPSLDDLAPMAEALSGARIVLLGDATRGDGSTFLAKARLIRYLHLELGFDVLALECGFVACDRAWRQVGDGEEAGPALDRALAPIFSQSAQFRSVVHLVAQRQGSERPLIVAGFDPQIVAGGGPAELVEELGRAVAERGTSLDEVPGFAEAATVLSRLATESYAMGQEPVPSDEARERFAATLDLVRGMLETSLGDGDDGTFWRQALDNIDAEARLAWEMGVYRPGQSMSPEVTNIRNRQMAENLLWLAEQRYPGRKIVVWSTSVHLARDLRSLDTGRDRETAARFERFVTVGDILQDALGDEAYTIAFTAFQGHTGGPFRQPYPLLVPTVGSFEELMARTGLEAAFVDLRGLRAAGLDGSWLAGPLIARPLSFKELRGSWPRHLDGLVFLRTLDSSRRQAAR